MGLLYRAMWNASEDDYFDIADAEFRAWSGGKHGDLELGDVGRFESRSALASIERYESEHGRIGRWELQEDTAHGRWITTLIAFCEANAETRWLWIDLQNLRNTFVDAVDIAAPRLARDLLQALPSSRRGPIRLGASASPLDGDDMRAFEALLVDSDREVPLVVFSTDQSASLSLTTRRAELAAKRLAGVASVYYLPPEHTDTFLRRFGRDMAVWAGACRVYLPRIDLSDPDPRSHRYFRERTFGRNASGAGERIARHLSPLVALQQPPAEYQRLHDFMVVDPADRLAEVALELDQLRGQNRALSDAKIEAEDERDEALLEVEMFLEATSSHNREVHLIWQAIEAAEATDAVARHMQGGDSDEDIGFPEEDPRRFADIPALVELYLANVVFHEKTCVDLDKLDRSPHNERWAAVTWRALLALERYATDSPHYSGNFRSWCATSANQTGFPYGKVVMTESGYVKDNPDRSRERTLPVDTAVHRSGQTPMLAHIAIASERPAPRMYFHDATTGEDDGVTGKIHIGFLGPHEHMQNLMTN